MPSILAQAASPTGLTSEQRPPPAIGNMSSTLRQTIETSGAPPAPQASRRAKPAAGQNGARRPLATPPSERSRSGGGGRKSPTPQRPSTPLRVEPPPALAAGSLCSTSGTSTPGAAAAAASAAMSASAGGGGLAARLVVPMLAIPLKPALPAVVETVDKPTKLAADRRLQRARLALEVAMRGTDAIILEAALREALDAGLPDDLLQRGMMQLGDLEESAAAQASTAGVLSTGHAAGAGGPSSGSASIGGTGGGDAAGGKKRALARSGSSGSSGTSGGGGGLKASSGSLKAKKPGGSGGVMGGAAAAGAPPLVREGSLVKLHGLRAGLGLQGMSNLNMERYNGRLGRVVDDPPPWLIKSASGASAEELVAVLLDSRSTDRERSSGIWVAVPRTNLRPV